MSIYLYYFSSIKRYLSNISADFTLFIHFNPNGAEFALVNKYENK